MYILLANHVIFKQQLVGKQLIENKSTNANLKTL